MSLELILCQHRHEVQLVPRMRPEEEEGPPLAAQCNAGSDLMKADPRNGLQIVFKKIMNLFREASGEL